MKTPEELAREWVETNMSWDRYECDWDGAGIETFLAGYKEGFEAGCIKGSMAMQWTLDSDWHFTPNVDHKKLATHLTKKKMKDK